jgi:FkbH-like protein
VVQLLQKSNQFNLTTRRHGEADLRGMQADGCLFGVFSYHDKFGPQGIIAVVVLRPTAGALEIESWVMSCRVLNRTVEQAIFSWILEQARGKEIRGGFIPTAKNALVRDLYAQLGFVLTSADPATGAQWWRYDGQTLLMPLRHFTRLRAA